MAFYCACVEPTTSHVYTSVPTADLSVLRPVSTTAALRFDSERWGEIVSDSVSISTIVHYRSLSRSTAVVEIPFYAHGGQHGRHSALANNNTTSLASPDMMHWGTCPLDFQLFNFSGHFRAAQTDIGLRVCCFRLNITQTHCRRFTFHTNIQPCSFVYC